MFNLQTQAQITQRYFNIILALNPNTLPDTEGTDWWVKGQVIGGLLAGLNQDIYLAGQNSLPLNSTGVYLDKQAASFSIPARIGAGPSMGTASLSAPAVSAVFLPVDTILNYSVNNLSFYVAQDTTIAIGQTGVIPFNCSTIGSGTQIPNNSTLTLQTPIDGISSVVIVNMTDGINQETDANFSFRLAQALQNPKTGGSIGDYTQWAFSVPGVTGAYPYPNYVQPGTLILTILAGGNDFDTILLTPPTLTQYYSRTAPQILINAVDAYVETVRPVNDSVLVNTVDTNIIQPSNIINVGVLLAQGLQLGTVISTYSLTVEQLIQREVRRAIISTQVGANIDPGNGLRYIYLADIVTTLNIGLSAVQGQNGIYASLIVDSLVDYNGSATTNILVPSNIDMNGNMPFVYDILYSSINVYLLS